MSLTPEQIIRRKKGIGGSDAARIWRGDWTELWAEKTSRAKPKDLSAVLAVQMGSFTEAFNATWYELQTDEKIDRSRIEETFVHPAYDWMLCHPDGLIVRPSGPPVLWEAKHTGVWDQPEAVLETYFCQVQHNMMVVGADEAVLSVFYGNAMWRKWTIAGDAGFQGALMAREEAFWDHVLNDTNPGGSPALPIPTVRPAELATIDMSGSNAWAVHAADWLGSHVAAKLNADAAKALKELVEAEHGFVHGHGLVAERTGRGLSLRAVTAKDAARIERMKVTEAA
jgi:predicted phage-related endonuclease